MELRQCACGDWFDPNAGGQKRCNACRFKSLSKRRAHTKPHVICDNRDKAWFRGEIALQWRAIPGYEGRYEISNQGDVLSLVRGRYVMRPTYSEDGFSILLSNQIGARTRWVLSRLMLITFRPVDHPRLYAAIPKNGNKHDMRLHNWKWVRRHGEYVGNAKLTEEDAIAIKRRLMADNTLSYRVVADEYGVNAATISHIMTGKNWRHVS